MPGLTRQQLIERAETRAAVAFDIPVQAPIGGWNTRESFDDLDPTDALIMDNWVPGLGAVRVREGRSLHTSSALVVTGSELAQNPDFETGDLTSWNATGSPAIVTSPVHAGTYACKITTAVTAYADFIRQNTMTVVPGERYIVRFWSYGDGVDSSVVPEVIVRNLVGGAIIETFFGHNDEEWEEVVGSFTVPAGVTSIRVYVYGPPEVISVPARFSFYDDFSVKLAPYGGTVETLAIMEGGNYHQLLGAESGIIYNATSPGIPTVLKTGFVNNRWNWSNFSEYLILVNGVDDPQEYDGVTLTDLAQPLVGPTNPIGCQPFKNRMYYWDGNSQSIWYTALFARAGTCTEFDLSQLTQLGGNIITMETWTHDGGNGPDDHAVFIMSSGEVIVFQGSSPSSTTNWALVGVFSLGALLGERCTAKYGGDLIIMSELDIVNMSKLIQGPEALANRSKISGALEAISEFAGSNLFDGIMYPKKKIALFNVPAPGGIESYQYVQNLITGAWSRLKGWDVNSWIVFNSDLYFGGTLGAIYKAFDGFIDETVADTGITEEPIESTLQTAWLDFGSPMNKVFHALKPYIKTTGNPFVALRTQIDYKNFADLSFPSEVSAGGTPWGSPWGSPWGTTERVDQDWKIAEGYGRVVSAMMKMTTNSRTDLASTLWHVEGGSRM